MLKTALSMFSSGNMSAGVREDRGNRVLTAFGLLMLLCRLTWTRMGSGR
jgi:hypothetical protein